MEREQDRRSYNELDELEAIADAIAEGKRRTWVPTADPAEADERTITAPRIVGRVVNRYEHESKLGKAPYPVVELLTKNGELVAVHAYRSVLRDELEDIPIGSSVLVEYIGLVEREEAASYHRYRVLTRAPAEDAATSKSQDPAGWGDAVG